MFTSIWQRAAAAAAGLAAANVAAFGIGLSAMPVTVVEYHNVLLDHYFLTRNPQEMEAIEAGSAGPGWVRTGLAFRANEAVNTWCEGCVFVSRFYGTPGLGPNSHFYTENPAESQLLQRPGSGWTLENDRAFAVRLPGVAGNCPAEAPVPVTRLYNNRWMHNDSNHRYVADVVERNAMRAAGWVDEGVHFCVFAVEETPVKTFMINVAAEGNVLPTAQCEDERLRVGGCIAVNNLPLPSKVVGSTFFGSPDFFRLTNVIAPALVPENAVPEASADGVFVQSSGINYGIHVDTSGRSVPELASINPLYQFRTGANDGAARFFPWRDAYSFATQLSIRWSMDVRRIETRTPQSHAYGHPTLEFIDTRSGKHLYFTVLAYGTVPDEGNVYVARDTFTGKVIVGTRARAGTPFGRNLGRDSFQAPRSFDAVYGEGLSGVFDFRIDRSEFERILASARSLDPGLSADPADYLLDNFHFNNEVYGDGEIGLNLTLALRVMRR